MLKTNVTGPLAEFMQQGRVSTIVGGQWGSEAKGCAAAWVGAELAKQGAHFDIWTTNAGAQAGHTSTHKDQKRVVFHLPTAPLIAADEFGEPKGCVYLNAGSIIDPDGLMKELEMWKGEVYIHPMAAVITDECREAEGKDTSGQTKIASTRKGVGEALSRKILRTGMVAQDYKPLYPFVRRIDLNSTLRAGASILMEVPQGVSLSINHSKFYPYTTSRDCTPMSGISDAGIHPRFYGKTMVVMRTFPIRVGNIMEKGEQIGYSGDCYHDQRETSWRELGVEAEITTVTKRIRRVFTWSNQQMIDTFNLCHPDVVFLTFCNYGEFKNVQKIVEDIKKVGRVTGINPQIIYQWGATTDDIGEKL